MFSGCISTLLPEGIKTLNNSDTRQTCKKVGLYAIAVIAGTVVALAGFITVFTASMTAWAGFHSVVVTRGLLATAGCLVVTMLAAAAAALPVIKLQDLNRQG